MVPLVGNVVCVGAYGSFDGFRFCEDYSAPVVNSPPAVNVIQGSFLVEGSGANRRMLLKRIWCCSAKNL